METVSQSLASANTEAGKPAEPLLVNDVEMARMLSVSPDWLRRDRIRDRRVPFCRLGGRVLYSPARVERALEELEEGGPQSRPGNARCGVRTSGVR